jgi:thymidine kinase
LSKLYFRHGAMNSGKSTALLQAAHNYEERDQVVLLAKPAVDTKGARAITSRLGVGREVDFLITPDLDLRTAFAEMCAAKSMETGKPVSCLLIDEAQFLSAEQVDQALQIAVLDGIPVLAYGIRTDFLTHGFPGSLRLLEIAHSLEELKTICRCGRKAMFNARLINSNFVFNGEQVAIDGEEVTYESLCPSCYFVEKDIS